MAQSTATEHEQAELSPDEPVLLSSAATWPGRLKKLSQPSRLALLPLGQGSCLDRGVRRRAFCCRSP